MAVIDKQIEERKTEIKPERDRLEKERADRIAAAEKVVEQAKAKLAQKIDVLSTAQEGGRMAYTIATVTIIDESSDPKTSSR